MKSKLWDFLTYTVSDEFVSEISEDFGKCWYNFGFNFEDLIFLFTQLIVYSIKLKLFLTS